MTFYETLEELPPFEDYSMEGRTYRYMKGKAQYPFGYGLTYGKAEVDSMVVSETETGADVSVQVKNTGKETFVKYYRFISSARILCIRFLTPSCADFRECGSTEENAEHSL